MLAFSTHLSSASVITVAALLLCVPRATAAGEASFTPLGDLPGGDFYSSAYGISADGTTVVGWSRGPDPGAGTTSHEAFRWTSAEGMVGLGDLDSTFVYSIARDVSADGSVIVGEGSLSGTNSLAYRWTAADGMVELTDPSGELTGVRAFGVSANGTVVVGTAQSAVGFVALRWTAADGMVSLGSLSTEFIDSSAFGVAADGEVVTGQSMSTPASVEPIRWTQQTGMVGLGDVPGGEFYALGWALSADGTTIVGGARTSFGSRDEAFIWTEPDGFILLDSMHGADFGSFANACSADGSVVVGNTTTSGAMIWDAQNGMRNVQDVLVDVHGVDLTGWTLWVATDVSADGTRIVGRGANPAGDTEAWVAHIPRPASSPVPAMSPPGRGVMILLIVAAGTIAMLRRTALCELSDRAPRNAS